MDQNIPRELNSHHWRLRSTPMGTLEQSLVRMYLQIRIWRPCSADFDFNEPEQGYETPHLCTTVVQRKWPCKRQALLSSFFLFLLRSQAAYKQPQSRRCLFKCQRSTAAMTKLNSWPTCASVVEWRLSILLLSLLHGQLMTQLTKHVSPSLASAQPVPRMCTHAEVHKRKRIPSGHSAA